MHNTNLFVKTVLSISVCCISTVGLAATVEHSAHASSAEVATIAAQADTQSHQSHQSASSVQESQSHDHRKEHGAQIYAVSTLDTQWQVNDHAEGVLKSKLQTRIGTDENKLFVKIHSDKQESQATEYDAKLLYSRMISDFWDVQAGVRYRHEVTQQAHQTDREDKFDAVLGLHGLAPYFFETDAYFYLGEDQYAALNLETTRDLLLTQKLIAQPYLDVDVILQDDAKYAKKTGLNRAAAGVEMRYEISKNIMPYINAGYEYTKGNQHTAWQPATDSEQGGLYAIGLRFRF
ncbi:MAG: copper resistance protein B [Acinetobacter sp.]|uniref:copper resistance protein B n=1 Tax=Acinetobacter sp. TaxID=472 RepID=UPI0026DF86F4|nr:copper resistance protein B [Acinetobacter sp.]MDO5542921.1 copper resistance protein B [Acinetobacter sp.]